MSPKEEQYFGVTTKAFVNDVYNVVDDYFADSIDLLERELLKQAGEAGKDQVKNGCDNILKVIRKLCDRNFDKFEVYLSRNIFHIPKEITLEQLNKERAKAYREDAKSIVSLEKDELEVEKAILQAQRELASLTSETAHLSAIVNANKTQIERTAQAIEEAKRHNSVNRQTLKSIVRGGSILEENTDKLMELTKRCGEQDASHFQNPLLLDIDSCKAFCNRLERDLGQPSYDLLVRLNKQICS